MVTEGDLEAMRAAVHRDLGAAVAFAEASPYPDPNDLLVDMFAE
jgi:TPP-dependent pyruvate/acetoin dehydrogenase alpha subunit